ncbi:MAG: membrane protein insertase YidC [Candidatus Pacebacteria bacterium]|nr:membrane protein insertase YidC [Candidatus Paceibacterota bacterium]
MTNLFHQLLIDPLLKLLVFLYEYITFHDLGVAIILLTVIVRLVLYPLFYKSLKQQHVLKKIQPHIQNIQAKHKDNRAEQGKALMALYKEHGVNPLMSLGLIFVQLPILIALYQVFITPPPELIQSFLGLITLSERSIFLVAVAAALQYLLGVMSMKGNANDKSPAAQTARNMVMIGPVITLAVLWSMPAAVGVYWVTTTLFSILQQLHVERKFSHGTH